MKKIVLALITALLFGVEAIKAQEQELNASEPISTGCLSRSNGEEASTLPTIKLTKEGSILSVDLLNYSSNCGTKSFEVGNKISGGNGDSPSVAISVTSVVPAKMDCNCPFNISYTVRDLEHNHFYLTCWWYEGQVELTEGKPLILEYKTEDVVIDGLKYQLLKTAHQAMLLYQKTWNGEEESINLPAEVEYEGEKYTVSYTNKGVFPSNTVIKRITIPKTIKNTVYGFSSLEDDFTNPFSSCESLEAIEVEEENPVVCSIDGVLFSKDKTRLIGYPTAAPRKSYTVPDGVKTLSIAVFRICNNLEEVVIPSGIKELPYNLFTGCAKLKSVVIPEGVTTIGDFAFEGCSSLESILFPESVVAVGTLAFWNCTSLRSATLSPNIKTVPPSLFSGCSELTEVIIPSGITDILSGAFARCVAMQSFDLPESINYIDNFAFRYIPNLKDIYCRATTVPKTTNNTFGDVDISKATLHVPAASIADYQAKSPWNQFGAIVPLETTGISEVSNKEGSPSGLIYNLQGQRISTLQKGLNIVNGQKVYAK